MFLTCSITESGAGLLQMPRRAEFQFKASCFKLFFTLGTVATLHLRAGCATLRSKWAEGLTLTETVVPGTTIDTKKTNSSIFTGYEKLLSLVEIYALLCQSCNALLTGKAHQGGKTWDICIKSWRPSTMVAC